MPSFVNVNSEPLPLVIRCPIVPVLLTASVALDEPLGRNTADVSTPWLVVDDLYPERLAGILTAFDLRWHVVGLPKSC